MQTRTRVVARHRAVRRSAPPEEQPGQLARHQALGTPRERMLLLAKLPAAEGDMSPLAQGGSELVAEVIDGSGVDDGSLIHCLVCPGHSDSGT